MKPNCTISRLRLVLFTLLLVLTVAPPHLLIAQTISPSADAPSFQERYPRYRLRPGDVMDLTFAFTPEFNQTVTVQPDGYINLRGVGDLRVQDKTTGELVESMKEAYRGILHEPNISIKLTEFEKPYFVVGGQVGHPGKYDLRGDTTVSQAVQIAGGFNEKAKRTDVVLFRRVSDQWAEVRRINLKRMLDGEDLAEDLHLRPGDMVLVPQSTMSHLARFIPVPNLGLYFNPLRY
jgi:protein involved in polysaccharide export with SLBB domain